MNHRTFAIQTKDTSYCLHFNAMASPCEVILDAAVGSLSFPKVNRLAELITQEVWRIEDKFSRYNPDSVCTKINNNAGKTVEIDDETFFLLKFADDCYQISEGLFDITSGVLRKVWLFDTSDNLPSHAQVNSVLPYIGWHKVTFNKKSITLQPNMELDFGGIGKEYAVDKVGALIAEHTSTPVLINFGGDLLATKPRVNGEPWLVGIEHPAFKKNATTVISFSQGAIATSGDAKRYLFKDKKRYSHILNVQDGWPIEHAPRSVTVAGGSCLLAGMTATLAMLQGENAEKFLTENKFKYWIFK